RGGRNHAQLLLTSRLPARLIFPTHSGVKGNAMWLIWMIIVGLIVGALAKLIMPGRDPGGIGITILLGIAGSMVAGFLGRAVGWYAAGQPAGFIASIVGAIILLALYRAITGGRHGSGPINRPV